MDFTEKNFRKLQAQNQRQDLEIRYLNQKLQAALGKLFGKSSEKINPDQLALMFGENSVAPGTPAADAEVEEVNAPRKKRKLKPRAERLSPIFRSKKS